VSNGIRRTRKERFTWRAGDIEILHHPDPEILKKAKEHQENARKLRKEKEQQK
jgi:hypothetical protein